MNQVKAGAALNYVIIFLNIITGLLYTPFMLRCLGQNEYGLYSLVASVITYLTLLDFGFGSAIVRYAAKIRATKGKDEEWSLYGMFLSAYLIIGLLITIGGLALYFNVDRMFDRTMSLDDLRQARIMMALMVGNLAVTFPLSIFGSIVTAYEKFVFQRTLNIVRILLSTVVLIGVLMLGYKAIAMVVVQTIFSLGTLFVNFLYCKYKLKIKVLFQNFDFVLLKEIMVFSWWNFLGAIVDRIYWSTGQFILGIYCGTIEVAVFSVAITIMHLYMSMSTSLNSVLLPRITRLVVSNENRKEISDLFIRTGRLQFIVISLILSGYIIFGRVFIQLWAGDGYSESYIIGVIFFITLLCPLIQNVGITILLARGQQKFRSVAYLIIAIFSLIGQLLVSPRYGATGCAIIIGFTLFIGQWVIMNIYYNKSQGLDIVSFWKQISKMAICPVLLTFAGLYLLRYVVIDSWLKLVSGAFLFTTLFGVLMWRFGMGKYEKTQLLSLIRLPMKY